MKFKGKIFGFMAVSLLLTVASVVGGFISPTGAQESSRVTTLTSTTLSTTVYDRNDHELQTADTGTYIDNLNDSSRNLSFSAYSWDEVKKIQFNNIRGNEIPLFDSYNLSLKVEYAPMYVTAQGFSTLKKTYDDVLTREDVKDLYHLENENLIFYFDPSPLTDGEPLKNYGFGWGLYRFTLQIGLNASDESGLQYYNCESNLIAIKPTVPTEAPVYVANKDNIDEFTTPVVTYDAVSSTTMQWAYEFKISNDIKYTYCDQKQIKWYVYGNATDGTPYVLTEDDRANPEFAGYRNSIVKGEVNRNGLTFTFDSNGVGGEWHVYCVVTNISTGETLKCEEMIVTTATKMNANTIYIIIGACAAAVLIAVVLIIILTKKKEKVW